MPFGNCSYLPASPGSFAEPPSSSVVLICLCLPPLEAADAGDIFTHVDFHTAERIGKEANDGRKQG